MNISAIKSTLSDKEISQINFAVLGSMVLKAAKDIKQRFITEIAPTIASWLNDKDFSKSLMIDLEKTYDFAAYKRGQRAFTELQRLAAIENLKAYREAVKRKKKLWQRVREIIPRSKNNSRPALHCPKKETEVQFLTSLISPFCPSYKRKVDTAFEFSQACTVPISRRYPYQPFIRLELKEKGPSIEFESFQPLYQEDSRFERSARLQHLLQMETEGLLCITQDTHLGRITVTDNTHRHQIKAKIPKIQIKTMDGKEITGNLVRLSNEARSELLADIKNRKILCKMVI